MERSVEGPSKSDSRHAVAADWLQRLDHPQLKEEELQSWLEWFGAADENRKAFEELQQLRRVFRELPDEYRDELKRRTGTGNVAVKSAQDDLCQELRSEPPAGKNPQLAPRFQGILPGRSGFGAPLGIAASVCAIALGVLVWRTTQISAMQATYTAGAGQHRTVALEDGSSLVLGSDSVVAVGYSRALRSLDIQRGEAYFEVRHDPKRPFIVQAAGVRVTALGTAFNVQRHSDRVTVIVTDGRVAVDGAEKELETGSAPGAQPHKRAGKQTQIYLGVGQRATLPLAASRPAETLATTEKSDWQEGRADFIDAPLSEVLPLINRYATAKVVIADPRVADFTYSGTIFRSHLDEWVASLPRIYPIRAVALEDSTTILVSRPMR